MAQHAPLGNKSAKAGEQTARKPKRGGGSATQLSAFGLAIQRKMVVGPSRDRFEAEADRAASHVVSNRAGTPLVTPLGANPAQRMPSEEEETVQRKPQDQAEDETLQRKTRRDNEEQPVQRKEASGGAAPVSSGVESGIRAARGGGRPLPPVQRSGMEAGFGRDFSAVRVHDDARANRMNAALNARAFTTGSDIFFSSGSFNPTSRPGRTLLAHELTHVAQQTGPGRLQASTIQRDGEEKTQARVWPDQEKTSKYGSIDLDGDSAHSVTLYRLPMLTVPSFGGKLKGVNPVKSITTGMSLTGGFVPTSKFHWLGKGQRSVTDAEDQAPNATQVQIWEKYMRDKGAIADKITAKFEKTEPKVKRGKGEDGPRVYYLRHKEGDANIFSAIGTAEELAKNSVILRPPFTRTGKTTKFMQVDHYIEIQLGGAHKIENMWLLDEKANQQSGRDIKNSVVKSLNALAAAADRDKFWGGDNPKKPGFKSWPDAAHVEFAKVKGAKLRGTHWDKDEIAQGKQIDRLKPLTGVEMAKAGFVFDPKNRPQAITVFISKGSAYRRVMKLKDDELTYRGNKGKNKFIRGFNLASAAYHHPSKIEDGWQVATLKGTAFGNRTVKKPDGSKEKATDLKAPLEVPVLTLMDLGFGGHIDTAYIDKALRSAAETKVFGFSLISFDSAGISDNWELMAKGKVTADNPLFPGLTFDIGLLGDAIFVDVTIPLERLKLGPFKATEANLRAGYGDKGPFFEGSAGFEIVGVGAGTLTATQQKLTGDFNFDIDAFDPAEITVTYENGAWSGGGKLGIGKGKIPYVDSADVDVAIDENGFSMAGTAALFGPGIKPGTVLDVLYDQETGLMKFGAKIVFDTAAIPGITNATAKVGVSRNADGLWSVAGAGSASIELPYVTGAIKGSYENGFLDMHGKATVSRPPLTGEGQFHLSNRSVNEAGEAIEGAPLSTFRIWGTGKASVTFGEYITGTIGIVFLENGEIELLGVVALPPSIPLIKPTVYHYDILKIPQIRFPIVGLTVPVIRKSFGVFAFIGGGIDANLTLGPGELVESKVKVAFNPDHPEEASITGGTTFQVSASADVGLTISGGIGAGLGIVEATGEVGLRGAVGLDLVGGAGLQLDWTPLEGLALDASVFGEAKPKFSMSLIADARIVVDAFLWSGTLWNKTWNKKLGEIGPDIAWKAELPAAWSEKDGLDVDIKKLAITKPNIDLMAFGKEAFGIS